MSDPIKNAEPEQMIEEERELTPEEEARADRARRMLTGLAAVIVVGAVAGLAWLYRDREEKGEKTVHEAEAPQTPTTHTVSVPASGFTDVTAEWGLAFEHFSGAKGEKLLPETMGAGVALFDHDRDGDMDVLFVNSTAWPHDGAAQPTPSRLFRNDGKRFTDVTSDVGLDAVSCYGMGVAIGDVDSDGWPDVYITTVGRNVLLRNADGRKFIDITESAGVGGNEWSSSAAFLDFDRDGLLDLFVLNYVKWSREIDQKQGFKLVGLGRAYGPPTGFEGEHPRLFRNLGGGRFEDVSAAAGVQVSNPATGVAQAKALGITVCDFNEDGLPDVIVANDTVRNFAFQNDGQGGFKEVGVEIGIAYDEKGNARGAMGIASTDYRNDGSLAVAIGNFANEMTALFVNEDPRNPLFYDEATSTGIGAPTRNSLTFGVAFVDYDLDGREDLVCANGHVEPEINVVQRSQHHAQPLELFWNGGGGRFVKATAAEAGPALFEPLVGRAIATGDLDGDGDLDLVVTANGGPARVLRNDQRGGRSVRLLLRTANRAALGAAVTLETDTGTQRRYLGGGTSYLGQNEPVLTFGLGAATTARNVVVTWPDGSKQTFATLEAGVHVIDQAP